MTSVTEETNDARYGRRTDYAERMYRIQLEFIDDPRKAALDANGLAGELLQSCADELTQLRKDLVAKPGDSAPDTEHLRQSVRRYREFVDTLAQTAHGPTENGQAELLELPEETTYRVGENGEAEVIDPSALEAEPEVLDRAERPERLDPTAAQAELAGSGEGSEQTRTQ